MRNFIAPNYAPGGGSQTCVCRRALVVKLGSKWPGLCTYTHLNPSSRTAVKSNLRRLLLRISRSKERSSKQQHRLSYAHGPEDSPKLAAVVLCLCGRRIFEKWIEIFDKKPEITHEERGRPTLESLPLSLPFSVPLAQSQTGH